MGTSSISVWMLHIVIKHSLLLSFLGTSMRYVWMGERGWDGGMGVGWLGWGTRCTVLVMRIRSIMSRWRVILGLPTGRTKPYTSTSSAAKQCRNWTNTNTCTHSPKKIYQAHTQTSTTHNTTHTTNTITHTTNTITHRDILSIDKTLRHNRN